MFWQQQGNSKACNLPQRSDVDRLHVRRFEDNENFTVQVKRRLSERLFGYLNRKELSNINH
jgi:hypothetical protein